MIRPLVMSAALLAAALGSAQAATVFSDNFDGNAFGTPGVNGTQNVAGWTVTDGTVDVIGTGFYEWYGTGGYLDMNGSSGTAGRIERTITGLTAGVTYLLSFDYGANKNSNGRNSSNIETLAFGIGGATGAIDIVGYVESLLKGTLSFTATSGTASLYFADAGNTAGDNGGPVLDNVSVDPAAVPLPAAAPLLLGGFGALALIRRRRRA